MRRRESAPEILDGAVPAAARAAALADMDRLNWWFGGYLLTMREIRRRAASATSPLVVVDVGGGHAAFAVRLVRRARRRGRILRVVVVERDPETLALARRTCVGYPEVSLVRADAAALPVREGVAHAVTASLTLHHLESDAVVAVLREMAAAGRAVVVNDLLRSRISLALVWLATRLLGCHPVARHDGLLSVRRAYSRAELHALAEKAGLARLQIRAHPLVGRLVAVSA